jgi:hypothetical protein
MASTRRLPTDGEISEIKRYISNGHFPEIAAVLAGIPQFIFQDWMSESTKVDADPQLIKLRVNLEVGAARLEETAVDNWVKAFGKDWKAAKDYLSIRFPERWDPDAHKPKTETEDDKTKKSVLELINNPKAREALSKLVEENKFDKED